MSDIEYLVLVLPIGIFVISWIIRGKRKEEEQERYSVIAFGAARSAEHAIRRAEAYSDHYDHWETRSKRAKAMRGKCPWCTTPYEYEGRACTKCGAPRK